MNTIELLNIINPADIIDRKQLTVNQWAHQIQYNVGQDINLSDYDFAIIGVEPVNGPFSNQMLGGSVSIRNEIYQLFNWEREFRAIDLGNLIENESTESQLNALSEICTELLEAEVIPFIIGASHDFTISQFKAFENLERDCSISIFDERIDLLGGVDEINEFSFLYRILSNTKGSLHHFIHGGYQKYLNDPMIYSTLNGMQYDAFRLGYITENIKRLEPMVRNSHVLSIDLSVVRSADAPGQEQNSLHGLNGEDMCRLARYAGMSDSMSSVGIFNYHSTKDLEQRTAQLIAQMLWHFVEGFYDRKFEDPTQGEESYMKYTIPLENEAHDLVFLKSQISDRWWMKIYTGEDEMGARFELIPCMYEDYISATKDELPDTWINAMIRIPVY